MGNNKFKLTKLALALGLTATLSGCFSDNDNNDYIKPEVPTQDVAVPPTAADFQAGSITVNLVDVTGAQLSDEVTATITFTSAEDGLLTVAGNELTDEDKATTNSSFAFTLESIPANGVSYDYVVSADGYLSNSGTFSLTTTENVEAAEIRLTPRTLANSPLAIVADTKTIDELVTAQSGTVTATYDPSTGLTVTGDATELVLQQDINKADVAVGGTTVKIKSGTQFLDKEGEALTSAPSLTVAYFANEATRNTTEAAGVATTDSSLDAFPGGLALSVTSPSDVTSTGSFTSGGFVAIELVDGEGNKVKNFGPGNTLTVAMQVDKNTSNPCPVKFDANAAGDITAQAEATAFAAGVCQLAAPVARSLEADDIFPIWSYDEDTGKWLFENYGLVVDNGNANTFDVEVEVNHLSYWNLDFFNNRRCNSVSFDILDSGDDDNTIATSIVLESSGFRRVFTSYRGDYSKATFANPPAFPVTVKVLRDGQNVLDGFANSSNGTAQALSVANMCDLNNEELKLTIAPPTIVTKQLTPQLVCSNTADFDVNTAPVVTPSVVTLFRNNRFVQNYYPTGTFSVNLEQATGVSYSARYYDYNSRTWLSTAIDATATAATLDIPVTCEVETVPVTGTGTTGGS